MEQNRYKEKYDDMKSIYLSYKEATKYYKRLFAMTGGKGYDHYYGVSTGGDDPSSQDTTQEFVKNVSGIIKKLGKKNETIKNLKRQIEESKNEGGTLNAMNEIISGLNVILEEIINDSETEGDDGILSDYIEQTNKINDLGDTIEVKFKNNVAS